MHSKSDKGNLCESYFDRFHYWLLKWAILVHEKADILQDYPVIFLKCPEHIL